MAYLYDFPNISSSQGYDDLVVNVVTSVPLFVPLLLITIFLLISLAGFRLQSYRRDEDLPYWLLLGSLGSLISALMLSMKEGLMNGTILGTCFAVTVLTAIWFFLSKGPREV